MSDARNVWKDKSGARHVVAFTVGIARRLKTECALDVMACLVSPAGFKTICDALASRPDLMLEALAIVHQIPDAESAAFFDQIDGDVFEAASAAFLYGLVDFFPQQSRTVLTRLLETTETLTAKAKGAAETSILQRLGEQDFISEIESFLTAGNGSKT